MELCSAKLLQSRWNRTTMTTDTDLLGKMHTVICCYFQDPLDLDLRSEWLRDERDDGLRFCAVVICPSSRSTLLARSLNTMSSNAAIPSAESWIRTDISVLQRLHVVQFVEPQTTQLSALTHFACKMPWPGLTLRPAAAHSS